MWKFQKAHFYGSPLNSFSTLLFSNSSNTIYNPYQNIFLTSTLLFSSYHTQNREPSSPPYSGHPPSSSFPCKQIRFCGSPINSFSFSFTTSENCDFKVVAWYGFWKSDLCLNINVNVLFGSVKSNLFELITKCDSPNYNLLLFYESELIIYILN